MVRLAGCRVCVLLAAVLLSACGVVVGPTQTDELPTPAAEPPPVVETVIVTVPVSGVVEPEGIRLQLDWSGGMLIPFVWSHLPDLTLLDDGTLIYQDTQAMVMRLTEPEAQALVQQVLDLGFEGLESHTGSCQDIGNGKGVCIMDATTSSIRLRMADGTLRQVDNYAEFADDPDVLRAIRAFLTDYRSPAAQPYIPEKAVLYVRTIGNPGDLEVLDWPLDPALLIKAPGEDNYCAQVVGRSEAETLAALPAQSMGFRYFREGSQVWEVVLVPWLPGADYTAVLAYNGLLCSEPTPAASPLAGTGWLLTLMEGQVLPADWTLTLRFTPRAVTASAGCNDVTREYVAAEDGGLSLSQAGEMTLVECLEPYASREKAYFHLVRRVVAYRLYEGRLEFLDDQGLVILTYDKTP